MAARPSWDGVLKINLVSIPVKAYTASASATGGVAFNQIHAKCNSRIRYKKVCPIHGEVPNEEIVPGYEVSKGEYVMFDKKELAQLKSEGDKAISIDSFVNPESVDPMLFSGRNYYLLPDGKLAQKSYAVVQKAMLDNGQYGVAEMVMTGKEHLVVVRPLGRLLMVSFLSYEDEVKLPSEFEDQVPETDVPANELHLAESLIQATSEESLDLHRYHDDYEMRVKQLIESKSAGKKAAPVLEDDAPAVINLMDALKQSLERTRKSKPAESAKPHRKAARPKARGKSA
jgi:DNA end-binding protein Ku